jgi:predicted enzyme related to lactoylglutathione lyase
MLEDIAEFSTVRVPIKRIVYYELMAKVTGFGGAFLRADDPKKLIAWYEEHLGISQKYGTFTFPAESQKSKIAVTFFARSADYFPASQPAMLNFQVDNLDELLDKLAGAGVAVDPKRDQHEYGRFGWFTDPEGNRVELWEPPA